MDYAMAGVTLIGGTGYLRGTRSRTTARRECT
jgi:hypothetical protein